MNGTQVERVLALIDANLALNLKLNRAEIIRYIKEHETEILQQLDNDKKIEIPTSAGCITIRRDQIAA